MPYVQQKVLYLCFGAGMQNLCPAGYLCFWALPYSAGKSANTKGKQGAILRAFFLRDLTCTAAQVLCPSLAPPATAERPRSVAEWEGRCGKKDFPVKNGRACFCYVVDGVGSSNRTEYKGLMKSLLWKTKRDGSIKPSRAWNSDRTSSLRLPQLLPRKFASPV